MENQEKNQKGNQEYNQDHNQNNGLELLKKVIETNERNTEQGIKTAFVYEDLLNPNSAIEKKEYFSILISNCVAVEKNKR